MSDPIKEISEAVKTRFLSPIFGTFIIAWAAWNWKVLAILLKSDAENSRSFIYEISGKLSIWHGLALPAISTVLYIIFTPLIGIKLAEYQGWVKNKKLKRALDQEFLHQQSLSSSANLHYIRTKLQDIRLDFWAKKDQMVIKGDDGKLDPSITQIKDKLIGELVDLRHEMDLWESIANEKLARKRVSNLKPNHPPPPNETP